MERLWCQWWHMGAWSKPWRSLAVFERVQEDPWFVIFCVFSLGFCTSVFRFIWPTEDVHCQPDVPLHLDLGKVLIPFRFMKVCREPGRGQLLG
jgi:hypothetical protein